MKILFTGASSFTGMWFARELAQAEHQVVATFQKQPNQYADALRRKRVELVLESCRGVFGCSFGDPAFMELIEEGGWNLLCHHAADVTNYKSPDFDVMSAVSRNTRNIAGVVEALCKSGDGRPALLATGSVFENDEGAGSGGLQAFSPYGLSKNLSYQVLRYYASRAGLTLGKFVIPNPFGPYEDPRFTAYLMKTWFEGRAAAVNTPDYVRDNIHVSLLARTYAAFAQELQACSGLRSMNPSGYPESQGAFALRYSREMAARLGIPCKVDLKQQMDFQEPMIRINTNPLDAKALDWNEKQAWDEAADYYSQMYRRTSSN